MARPHKIVRCRVSVQMLYVINECLRRGEIVLRRPWEAHSAVLLFWDQLRVCVPLPLPQGLISIHPRGRICLFYITGLWLLQ
jgi:hypothetical protein